MLTKHFIKNYIAGLVVTTALVSASTVMAGTVKSLNVTGNKRIETQTVLSYIPLKPGVQYNF